jgi:hypothetical protein
MQKQDFPKSMTKIFYAFSDRERRLMLMSIQVDSMDTKEFVEKWAATLVRTDAEIMEHLEILKDARLVREFRTHGYDSRVEVTDLCDKAVVGLRDLVENPLVV